MKIYLAGPCDSEHRTLMNRVKKFLAFWTDAEIYAPWELKIENAWDYTQEEWARYVFDADITALNEADCVVMISVGRLSSAGTNWEQGYAYANNKPIYVLQITDQPTSLMTWCGCSAFWNVDGTLINDLEDKLKDIGRRIVNGQWSFAYCHNSCSTTLT